MLEWDMTLKDIKPEESTKNCRVGKWIVDTNEQKGTNPIRVQPRVRLPFSKQPNLQATFSRRDRLWLLHPVPHGPSGVPGTHNVLHWWKVGLPRHTETTVRDMPLALQKPGRKGKLVQNPLDKISPFLPLPIQVINLKQLNPNENFFESHEDGTVVKIKPPRQMKYIRSNYGFEAIGEERERESFQLSNFRPDCKSEIKMQFFFLQTSSATLVAASDCGWVSPSLTWPT